MSELQSTLGETERSARDWWNGWADYFQAEYGDGDVEIGIDWGPGAPLGDDLGLLGDVDGTRAIELGCGGAQFGIALAERGAAVTGVDVSEAQLAHARENAAERGQEIDFVHASVTDMPSVPDDAYDLAFSAFAFQWVGDLEACFAEAHRVVREGGRLVFSVDHPFYKLLDPETREFTASYFGDEPRRVYSEQFDAAMVIHRRRISETVSLLTDAGFAVETIREPGYDDPGEYDSEFGSFDPDLMADVPPTVVYAARAD
jgi:SAM-dependent methyltransferase